MNTLTKSKWQLRAAAAVIFLLGVAAGTLAPLAYRGWAHGGRSPRSQGRGDRFDQMLKQLELDGGQEAQVKQILNETRERLRALRRENEPREREIKAQTDERLRQVLTPEQWQKFQAEMSERRGRGRGGRRGPPPGDQP